MSELPTNCPYCGRALHKADSADFFRRGFGPILVCEGFGRGCRTYAEIDPESGRLRGRLADDELRGLRRDLRAAIRPLWAHADRYHKIKEQGRWRKEVIRKLREDARLRVYRFLAQALGQRRFFIKDLSKSQCRLAIKICKQNTYRSIHSTGSHHDKERSVKAYCRQH